MQRGNIEEYIYNSATKLPSTYSPRNKRVTSRNSSHTKKTSFITKVENRYPLSVKTAYKNIICTMDKACKDFNFHAKTSKNA
jgi:hypothetical protein